MKNLIKISLPMLSVFFLTSLYASQQNSLVNDVIKSLTTLSLILNKIESTNVRANYKNTLENVAKLVSEGRNFKGLLNSPKLKESEIKAIIDHLNKTPKNPLFAKFSSLFKNKDTSNGAQDDFDTVLSFISVPELSGLASTGGSEIFFTPERLITTIEEIIILFGYDPKNFVNLNKK